MSRAFQFKRRVMYEGVSYVPTQIVMTLSQTDADMLRKGGYGDYVGPEIEIEEPHATNPSTGTEVASGAGSDDPAAPGADPGPNSCAECNGRVFKTPQALASHVAQKH